MLANKRQQFSAAAWDICYVTWWRRQTAKVNFTAVTCKMTHFPAAGNPLHTHLITTTSKINVAQWDNPVTESSNAKKQMREYVLFSLCTFVLLGDQTAALIRCFQKEKRLNVKAALTYFWPQECSLISFSRDLVIYFSIKRIFGSGWTV